MPLLDVGPLRAIRNRNVRQREQQPLPANIGVAHHVVLRGLLYQGRSSFEILGIAFHAVGVLEEDSVAGAHCHSSIAERIPREAETWRGVEQVSLQTAAGHGSDAALRDSVE